MHRNQTRFVRFMFRFTSSFSVRQQATQPPLMQHHPVLNHRRSQGPATLGSWPGSHVTAEAGGGEGGAYAGSPAGARRTEARARGDWREAGGGAADAAAETGTAPPSLDAVEGEPPTRGRRSALRTEPERGCEEESVCKEPAVRGFDGPLNKSPYNFFSF